MSWNPNMPDVNPVAEGVDGSLQHALWRFLEHTRARGYTRQTQYSYARYGQEFVAWCTAVGLTQSASLPSTVLTEYQHAVGRLRKRDGQLLSVRSQLSKLIPVRAFARWLGRQVPAMREALNDCELPKAPRTLPRALLSPRDMERLLKEPNTETPVGLRDRSILEVFYGTGLRHMELLKLAVDDLDQQRLTLMVREGKGKRDRVVPVGERVISWLVRYLTEGRPRLVADAQRDTQILFVQRGGGALSPTWMSSLVNGYLRRIRPGRRGACHLLRHSMATAMLENNADIRFIQALLGHEQLSSTQIYTQVSMHQLRRVYEATHPTGGRQKKLTRHRAPRHPLQRDVQALLADLPLNASWDDLIQVLSLSVNRRAVSGERM